MFNNFSKIFVLLFILFSLGLSISKAEDALQSNNINVPVSKNVEPQQAPTTTEVVTPTNQPVTPAEEPVVPLQTKPVEPTEAPLKEENISKSDTLPEEKNIKKDEKNVIPVAQEEKKSGEKKTEEEQLKGYEQITNWLIDNKQNFEDIIKENAVDTKTKWFAEEEYEAKKAEEQKKQDKSEEKPKTQKLFHLVKKGDTLYSISNTYNISQENILKWNNITGAEGIQLDKVLTLYDVEAYEKEQLANKTSTDDVVSATDVPTVPSAPIVDLSKGVEEQPNPAVDNLPEYKYYRVQKGDTFSSIAKSNYMSKEELIALNNFNSKSVLSVDQIVKVKSNYGDSTKKEASGIVKDGFIWPVVGRLLIPFGTQEQGLVNEGINIAAKKGTEIKATQEGVVIYIGDGLKSFGNLILVQHDKNWVSAYAHVDEIKVNKGQKVLKGQSIANVSDSGDVSTPQLHFELRYNVKPMDPLNYLVSYR